MIDKTENLKIVLVSDYGSYLDMPDRYNNSIEIKTLEKFYAARLLKLLDKSSQLLGNIELKTLIASPIFNYHLTNLQIKEIYQLLKSKKNLDEVAEIVEADHRRGSIKLFETEAKRKRDSKI